MPVRQSFDWTHGIITCGAFLETVTTFATVEEEGKPEINAMSIQDFVSIPLGKYITNNVVFGSMLKNPPLIFGVNYFLRDKDGYVSSIRDKAVWAKWMELRVHGDVDAVETPIGYIPEYEDLRELFNQVLGVDYSREQYARQFTLRVPQNLAKLDRMEKHYRTQVADAPAILFEVLDQQRKRLLKAAR